MGGRGPAPSVTRRHRAAPLRGDWIDLPPTSGLEVPKIPHRRPAWLAATRRQWEAWWSDPAATQWGPADHAAVEMLAALVDNLERGNSRLAPEIRLRMDTLGLSPKGKRDLRLRVVTADEIEQQQQRATSVRSRARERGLRAVDPDFDPRKILEQG